MFTTLTNIPYVDYDSWDSTSDLALWSVIWSTPWKTIDLGIKQPWQLWWEHLRL